MKRYLMLSVLITAVSLLLIQGGFYSQTYDTSLHAEEGNPSLSSMLKKGIISELSTFGSQHIGTYTQWSTSYLKATGKAPEKPAVTGDKDPEEIDYEYDQVFDRWSSMYNAYSAMDGNPATAWCEGKEDEGIGEILIVKADILNPVYIWNGLGKNNNLYFANNRAKKIRLTVLQAKKASKLIGQFNIGITYNDITVLGSHDITLKDHNGWQPLPIPTHKRLSTQSIIDNKEQIVKTEDTTFIAVEILSVYKGTKYNDTCISEIGNN